MQKIFSENVSLRTKFDFRLKKQKKKLGQCVVYGNCMVGIFFISGFFCHQSVQLFSKSRRNGLFFSIVFRKCMKILWQAFSPYTWCMELYDNDFCCMEVYDKHFRCMELNPGGSSVVPIRQLISQKQAAYILYKRINLHNVKANWGHIIMKMRKKIVFFFFFLV